MCVCLFQNVLVVGAMLVLAIINNNGECYEKQVWHINIYKHWISISGISVIDVDATFARILEDMGVCTLPTQSMERLTFLSI